MYKYYIFLARCWFIFQFNLYTTITTDFQICNCWNVIVFKYIIRFFFSSQTYKYLIFIPLFRYSSGDNVLFVFVRLLRVKLLETTSCHEVPLMDDFFTQAPCLIHNFNLIQLIVCYLILYYFVFSMSILFNCLCLL